ncbi:COG0816 Predicted endonuclease involved in recombination (possible Holliday junction resolvase in Mycoplasmas and B. subtilis) [actinobacterium SCGC AAA044-D11]
MQRGRRIAFDFGDVRIGVAVTDPSGILASPLAYLPNSQGALEIELKRLYQDYDPIYTAIGFPIHLSGAEGEKSRAVKGFAELIQTITTSPIYLIDERMTTVSANRTLREAGHDSKSSKEQIDSMAATAILESALNQERIQGEPMNRF